MFRENDSRFAQPDQMEAPLPEPPEPLRRILPGVGKTPKYKSGSSAWKRDSQQKQDDPHYRAWRDALIKQKQKEVAEAEAEQLKRVAAVSTDNLPIQTHAQKWSAEEVATLHRVAAETGINSGPKLARLLAPILGRSVSAVKNAVFHYRVLESLEELKRG